MVDQQEVTVPFHNGSPKEVQYLVIMVGQNEVQYIFTMVGQKEVQYLVTVVSQK